MNVAQAYEYSVMFLKANGVDEPEFKAKNIICETIPIKLVEFDFHKNDFVNTKKLADFLWRLKSGEPLQYVIGKWDFYESEFEVGKGVLIPRPETEELVDEIVKYAKTLENPVIIDLCAGSGCIGISIAKKIPSSTVYCVEKSEDAFEYLLKNSKDVANVITVLGDIFESIDLPNADIIVSNPPYIKSSELSSLQSEVLFEPEMALDGGADGLDFYRIINDKWSAKLNNGGRLFLEIGNDQGESIKSVMHCFRRVCVKKDMYGNDRIVIAKID